jgi:hypothetical protein
MNAAARTYLIQFLSAMGAYVVLMLLSIYLLQRNPEAGWRGLVAVLPAIPATLVVLAVVRFVERMDELQRRIQLVAAGFAAGATAVLTFTWGLLENAGFPRLSMLWVFPLMCALWGIGAAVATYRYR